MLQVADSGIGIDSQHQDRIFERFYQVDGSSRRMHGGCGLGLARRLDDVLLLRNLDSLGAQLERQRAITADPRLLRVAAR